MADTFFFGENTYTYIARHLDYGVSFLLECNRQHNQEWRWNNKMLNNRMMPQIFHNTSGGGGGSGNPLPLYRDWEIGRAHV